MSYRIIQTDMWQDIEFRRGSIYEKMMFVYALTSPSTNAAGFYRLPLEYIARDLRDKTKETEDEAYEKAKVILSQGGKLIKYDFDTEQILVPNFLKYNNAKSINQLKGVASGIKSLEYCPMFVDFFFYANKYGAIRFTDYVDETLLKYVLLMSEQRIDDPKGYVVNSLLNNLLNK